MATQNKPAQPMTDNEKLKYIMRLQDSRNNDQFAALAKKITDKKHVGNCDDMIVVVTQRDDGTRQILPLERGELEVRDSVTGESLYKSLLVAKEETTKTAGLILDGTEFIGPMGAVAAATVRANRVNENIFKTFTPISQALLGHVEPTLVTAPEAVATESGIRRFVLAPVFTN